MNPPPTTTARRTFCSTTRSLKRSVSSTVRRVSTRAPSTPGSAGFMAAARARAAACRSFPRIPAAQKLPHPNSLCRAVDGKCLAVHPHVDMEALKKALRGLQGQLLFVLDHPAHVVGQAAVGVRNKAAALQHHDLCLFVEAAQAGRCRSAPRHAADDDDLHARSPFSSSPA